MSRLGEGIIVGMGIGFIVGVMSVFWEIETGEVVWTPEEVYTCILQETDDG